MTRRIDMTLYLNPLKKRYNEASKKDKSLILKDIIVPKRIFLGCLLKIGNRWLYPVFYFLEYLSPLCR